MRIAVAGAGQIGRRHVELIRRGEQSELAAIVDPASAAGAFACGLDVPHFASLRELSERGRKLIDEQPSREWNIGILAEGIVTAPTLMRRLLTVNG